MTILLSILNKSDESEKTVEVEYHDKSMDSSAPDTFSSAGEIKPGETKELYIHDLRYLVVKEKKGA